MIKTDKNIRKSYKSYCNATDNPVDIKLYIELANNYNRFLMEKVLEGYEVTMPARTGVLSVIGRKKKIRFNEDGDPMLAPDWKKTKALWDKSPEAKEQRKKVYHTNDHTGGVGYKFFWSKKRIFVTNKNLYSLQLTREHKRTLASLINKGKEYYIKS